MDTKVCVFKILSFALTITAVNLFNILTGVQAKFNSTLLCHCYSEDTLIFHFDLIS